MFVQNVVPTKALVCLFAGGKLGPKTIVKGESRLYVPGPILLLNADGSPRYEDISQDFILTTNGVTDVSKGLLFVPKHGKASIDWFVEGRRFGISAQWQPS